MKQLPKLVPNWVSNIGVLFAVSIVAVLYIHLGRDPLFDWDEGIYAELGQQLLFRRDLFTSWWNGEQWFEKPPGLAWVSALGMMLTGTSSFGARFLMPLFAGYTLYIIYLIGHKLGGWKQGLIAAGVLATFNLFLGRTRAVNADMPLLAGIATTVLLLIENKRSIWVSLAVAVSVWFKGPAGLLAALIPLPLFISRGSKYTLRTALLTIALLLPWHLYSYFRYGMEFVTPYVLEQVVRRVSVPIEFHMESRWYYVQYLYENLGLGVLLVASFGVLSLIIRMKSFKNFSNLVANHSLPVTILWWLLLPFVIFTISKTRLFWYILPVYPALALLVSEAISHFAIDKRSRMVVGILAIGVWCQALLITSRSVEIARSTAPLSDRLTVVSQLANSSKELAVLVPHTERQAEALLPAELRLGSSFRYGGMPSIVFYYQGPVKFFYNVDEFRMYWDNTSSPRAMIEQGDVDKIEGYQVDVETPTYLGIEKRTYALR